MNEGMTAFSRASRMIMPLAYPFFLSTFHPWGQDGDEGDSGGVVADLLDEVADLLGDLLIPDDNNINDDLDVSERVGREFVIF